MSGTDDRDKELDALEKELDPSTPFIAEPDEKKVGDGAICWFDRERMCSGDCVAFNWEERPLQAPNQCLVMAYLGQIASASLIQIRASRRAQQRAEDQQRVEAAAAEVPKP